MSFYRRDGEELMVAPNFVRGPGFDLFAETQAENTYPVDGWYWFDTLDEAMTALRSPVQVNEVSRFQARAALHLAGYLEAIETVMADPTTDVLTRLAWQDAQSFYRASPTVAALAGLLGLDDAALDQLFLTASQITA